MQTTNPMSKLLAVVSCLAITLATAGHAQLQQTWVAHYNNGITNGTHEAVKMALDGAGNIYVSGFSQLESERFSGDVKRSIGVFL